MDIQEFARRILAQRQMRFPNTVPGLEAVGVAPCRVDGPVLRIAFAGSAPGAAAHLVAGVIGYAAPRGLAISWNVIPGRAGEAELLDALHAQGFRDEEGQRLMGHEGALAVPPNPRVHVVPIGTWEAMRLYEYGSRAAFFDDPRPERGTVERRARERMRDQQNGWCRYFAALLDGRLVGGCYYTRYEEVPTIMGVYTVPEAQRQGVASSVLAHTVAELEASGYTACCLYVRHGNPAERLYAHLGFVTLLDEFTLGRELALG
ncbi:MAG TPA: GNAT family N-acetyltransferase [Ktedonobacterales bacterium]|jgi:GNAT superfamily N-acetyltransferase